VNALPGKFRDPLWTAKGERRAAVSLSGLRTLWFNTGTLCNITCAHCYIESSPRNDALSYMTAADVRGFLEEAAFHPLEEVGFTGGEPFMNPELPAMLEDTMAPHGLRALVLTNARRPMMLRRETVARLHARYPGQLTARVSLDHYDAQHHDAERGAGSFARAMEGLRWLVGAGLNLAVAGRAAFGHEPEDALRAGFARLFAADGIALDATDPVTLVLFPEMDPAAEVPEITEVCWGILHRSPDSVMCALSRMVVRRRGADRPAVLACTPLAYDERFEPGSTLAEASGPVKLNHPHCARFCVLGGAACSR